MVASLSLSILCKGVVPPLLRLAVTGQRERDIPVECSAWRAPRCWFFSSQLGRGSPTP